MVSNRLQNLPVSAVRKLTPYAQEAKAKGVKVYHLNIGDPDIKTPDVMIDVLHNWKQNPIRYAASQGETELINSLQKYYNKIGFDYLEIKNLMITQGGSEALMMAFFAVTAPDDEIIVFEPYYSSYASIAAQVGVKLKAVSSTFESGFHLPLREEIVAAVSDKTKAILICTPGNPTGTVYTEEEMTMLAEIANEHNLFLISDEVYREYVFVDRPQFSILNFMQKYPERMILLDSLSKRYSLCGARIGIIASLNEEIIKGVFKMAQARLSGGLIDQVMAAQLVSVPDDYIANVQSEYKSRRDFIYTALTAIPGVSMTMPEGAFYSMVKLPVEDSEKFCIWLLQEFRDNNETLMLAPGAGFYATEGKGKNEVRIAYVLNKTDLARSVEILRKGLEVYVKE